MTLARKYLISPEDTPYYTHLNDTMAYVDLNPIRAAIARTPENSDYTLYKKGLNLKTPNY